MLQTNGLLAAWAFLVAKQERAREDLSRALLRHFQDQQVGLVTGSASLTAQDALLRLWTGPQAAGPAALRRLTAEAIVYAGWLKRAAEAICDTGESDSKGEGGAP
jgi:hypothetical protein